MTTLERFVHIHGNNREKLQLKMAESLSHRFYQCKVSDLPEVVAPLSGAETQNSLFAFAGELLAIRR